MRACARPLKISLVPHGTIPLSLPVLVTVNQCPGIAIQTVITTPRKQCLALPRKRGIVFIGEREERERAERGETCIHDARWATERPGDLSSTHVPDRLTQSGPQVSDPISAMRPAVYYPHESVGNSTANDNSSLEFGQELGGLAGPLPALYKPAVPDPQHHTWTSSFTANSLEAGPPSPTRTLEACSSDSRTRTGIVYPLQPRSRRPDTLIEVEASLPESAALRREELLPSREVPTDLTRPAQRLGRKRRRKRSSALYRPAKRSPPRGRWCIL